MDIPELSNEQRRQLIDAQQVFSAWRPLTIEQTSRPRLYWNTAKGVRYLYNKRAGVPTSLGKETPELTQQKQEHDARTKRLRLLLKPLSARIEQMAPVNRALRIARLPTLPAKILRLLDDRNLLDRHIIIAGTNALYAYEVAAGVLITGDLLATGDADLLWDARQSLELAAHDIPKEGLMGLLRMVDETFEAHYGYNATNSDGYVVDLITPEGARLPNRIGSGPDLEATQMTGIEWLLDAPRFEQIVVAADGVPLRLVVPEPRTFALHKLWLSRQHSRQPLKRPRDLSQAKIIAHIAKTYLDLQFEAKKMTWLPSTLADLIPELR